MGKLSRRSFLHRRVGVPRGMAAVSGSLGEAAIEGSSRRVFLQSTAGAVGGAAMVLAGPKVAHVALEAARPGSSTETKAVVTEPSGPPPREPVTAYVHNAERGEVTVMSGTFEATYRDPVLAKRLLDAAR
jgi:hypothetical protein